MSKRLKNQLQKLDELEDEFAKLLLICLTECSRGRWRLFGQNEHLDPEGGNLNWPESSRLKQLAQAISSQRFKFGQPSRACEQFLHYCSLRGANVPGEPKLASLLLTEIGHS